MKVETGPPHVINSPRDTRVKDTLVARPLLMSVAQKAVQVRTGCIYEQNVCSFSDITSQRNSLLLFVKHNIEQAVANVDPETFRKAVKKYTTKGGCLSLRRWWTLSTSAVKLFC
jgi:hypothetical protein